MKNALRMTPDELSDRLWSFAARIGKVVDALPDTRLGRHVSGQLVRSGTAAPPNYDEARVGESRADFAHKTNVALKDLVETPEWLRFIILAQLLPARRIEALVEGATNYVESWENLSQRPRLSPRSACPPRCQ